MVAAIPVTLTFASAVTVTEPTLVVAAIPVTLTSASAVTVTEPTLVVAAIPVTGTLASAMTLAVPTLPVAPGSPTSWPHGPPPQLWVDELQPLKEAVTSVITLSE